MSRPYFETKVVEVKKCEHKQVDFRGSFIKCCECGHIMSMQNEEPKGNWVNGENLDKIKFPCFCSYVHGSKKMGILSKLGNHFYVISIDNQADCTKYFLSYDLKRLIEEFNIHIIKGKIIIFEEV